MQRAIFSEMNISMCLGHCYTSILFLELEELIVIWHWSWSVFLSQTQQPSVCFRLAVHKCWFVGEVSDLVIVIVICPWALAFPSVKVRLPSMVLDLVPFIILVPKCTLRTSRHVILVGNGVDVVSVINWSWRSLVFFIYLKQKLLSKSHPDLFVFVIFNCRACRVLNRNILFDLFDMILFKEPIRFANWKLNFLEVYVIVAWRVLIQARTMLPQKILF